MQLLLLLRLSWPVWGAEVFRGEWERALRGRRSHCQGMKGLKLRERAAGRTGNREGSRGCPWDLLGDCHLYLDSGPILAYSD